MAAGAVGSECSSFVAVRSCSFFFFQAEDGIRDSSVTGVQDVCSSDLRVNRIGLTVWEQPLADILRLGAKHHRGLRRAIHSEKTDRLTAVIELEVRVQISERTKPVL